MFKNIKKTCKNENAAHFFKKQKIMQNCRKQL